MQYILNGEWTRHNLNNYTDNISIVQIPRPADNFFRKYKKQQIPNVTLLEIVNIWINIQDTRWCVCNFISKSSSGFYPLTNEC